MEILGDIVFILWCLFTVWYFVGSLTAIFDDDYDKKGMVRALGKFIVAAITATVLYSLI
jgi:hypothetical protein